MARQQRDYFIRDGVLFEADNVRETARLCLPRNLILQSVCASIDAAAERFVQEVLSRIAAGTYQLDQMMRVYDAWFVVDQPAPRSFGIADIDLSQAKLQVNFFVRPGRQPILRKVADRRSTPSNGDPEDQSQ